MRRTLPALLLALAPAAHAGPQLGIDGGWAVPLEGRHAVEGPGLAGRFGLGVDLQLVELVPEVGVLWSGTFVPEAGLRLVFGQRLRPGAYAHLLLPLDGGALEPGADAGLSLDFGLPRRLGLGVYAGAVAPALDLDSGLSAVGGLSLTIRL